MGDTLSAMGNITAAAQRTARPTTTGTWVGDDGDDSHPLSPETVPKIPGPTDAGDQFFPGCWKSVSSPSSSPTRENQRQSWVLGGDDAGDDASDDGPPAGIVTTKEMPGSCEWRLWSSVGGTCRGTSAARLLPPGDFTWPYSSALIPGS